MNLLKFFSIILLGLGLEVSTANPVVGGQGKTLDGSAVYSPQLPGQEASPPASGGYRSQTSYSGSAINPSAEAEYPPMDYTPEFVEQDDPKLRFKSNVSQHHEQPVYSTPPAIGQSASFPSSNVSTSNFSSPSPIRYSAPSVEEAGVPPNPSAYGYQEYARDIPPAEYLPSSTDSVDTAIGMQPELTSNVRDRTTGYTGAYRSSTPLPNNPRAGVLQDGRAYPQTTAPQYPVQGRATSFSPSHRWEGNHPTVPPSNIPLSESGGGSLPPAQLPVTQFPSESRTAVPGASSAYGVQDYRQAEPPMTVSNPGMAHSYRRDIGRRYGFLPGGLQTTSPFPRHHGGRGQGRADIPIQPALPAYGGSLPHGWRYDSAAPQRTPRRGAFSPMRDGYGYSAMPNYHGTYTPSSQYLQPYPVPRRLYAR